MSGVRISPGARCCVLEQDTTSLSLISTGVAQEIAPTWLKIVDWDVRRREDIDRKYYNYVLINSNGMEV